MESLSLTVGLDAGSVRRLHVFRKRRNTTEYDHAGVTSEAEAGEVRALAESVRRRVVQWLESTRPELVS